MKTSKSRTFPKTWILAAAVYGGILLVIYILAYFGKLPSQLSKIPHHDIILHFLLYGLAAYIGHQAFQRRKVKLFGCNFALWPLLYSIFTIVEETAQIFSPNRTFSWLDLGASLLGILVGYGLVELSQTSWKTRRK